MDRPAFHRADELVTSTRELGLLFDAEFDDRTLDRAIADEVNLLLRWQADRTERQFEYLRGYERRGTQRGAGEALDVTRCSLGC